MNKNLIFSFTIAILVLTGCDNESQNIGQCTYYPSFLFVKERHEPAVKNLKVVFNKAAINDPEAYIELQFTNNEGKPISPDVAIIKLDGIEVNSPIKLYANEDSIVKKLEIFVNPKFSENKLAGHLMCFSKNIDRINDKIEPKGNIDILKWNVDFKKRWNPLLRILFWLFVVILALTLLYKLLLQNILYPRFHISNRTLSVNDNFQIIKFGKCIAVIITGEKNRKVNWLNRFFRGKTQFYYVEGLNFDITIKPYKNKYAIVKSSSLYTVNNPIIKPFQNSITIIESIDNRIRIEIK